MNAENFLRTIATASKHELLNGRHMIDHELAGRMVRGAPEQGDGPPRRLIGLIGLKGCGKSTVAQWLCNDHGFHRLAFATPLKRMLEVIIPAENLYGSKKEEVIAWLGCSGRHAMQTLGTDWGRQMISPTLWVDALARNPEFLHGRAVVDDCRFPDEAELIRSHGGEIWKIHRSGCGGDGHRSELESADIVPDVELFNDGEVGDLVKQITTALNRAR